MLFIETPESQSLFLWQYGLPVLFGFLLLSFFPSTKHYQKKDDVKKYYTIQMFVIFSAIAGAKITVLFANRFWMTMPESSATDLLFSGRSIVGGLLFGFLAAEITKPFLGYKLPPNDRFAMVLPFSVAIGRIGCLLAGCCRGLFFDSRFSIEYSDHITRHAIPFYEMTFHVSMGILFVNLVRRKKCEGQIFALYLMSYGGFRFFTEFMRETPKTYGNFSLYQWLCLAMLACGMMSFLKRKTFKNQYA